MKKKAFLLIAFMATILCACSKNDNDNSNDDDSTLHHLTKTTWISTESGKELTLTFDKNKYKADILYDENHDGLFDEIKHIAGTYILEYPNLTLNNGKNKIEGIVSNDKITLTVGIDPRYNEIISNYYKK